MYATPVSLLTYNLPGDTVTQISKANLSSRLQDYPRGNYSTVFSVMKGVTLANAALVISPIVGTRSVTSILLWLASFLAVVLTNQAVMFGTVIIAWNRLKLREIVFSFILGILEFWLFGLSVAKTLGPWLLCFAAFSMIGGALAMNAASEARPAQYAADVQSSVKKYADAQKVVVAIAGLSSVFWLAASVNFWNISNESRTGIVLSSIALLNIAYPLFQQSKDTRNLTESLMD
jgi:hypothetical protein